MASLKACDALAGSAAVQDTGVPRQDNREAALSR